MIAFLQRLAATPTGDNVAAILAGVGAAVLFLLILGAVMRSEGSDK